MNKRVSQTILFINAVVHYCTLCSVPFTHRQHKHVLWVVVFFLEEVANFINKKKGKKVLHFYISRNVARIAVVIMHFQNFLCIIETQFQVTKVSMYQYYVKVSIK